MRSQKKDKTNFNFSSPSLLIAIQPSVMTLTNSDSTVCNETNSVSLAKPKQDLSVFKDELPKKPDEPKKKYLSIFIGKSSRN